MDREKGLGSVNKVWRSGTTLVIAIPRRIREILNIQKGDYVEVDWGEIVKRDKKEMIENKKGKRTEKLNRDDLEEVKKQVEENEEKEEEDEGLPELD